MLRRYVEQILSVYNYIDGIVVTDNKGVIEYYTNFRPDLNILREKDVIGKHILDVYPGLTQESSSVMRVLRSGRPVLNEFQTVTSYKGEVINALNNTLPIRENNRIIGAVDVSRYVDDGYQRQDIVISIKETNQETRLYTVDDIMTASPVMEDLKDKIRKISSTDSSVLIYGQTGTGKELVAQSIHTGGSRRQKRFLSQNCAAIPSSLLESILFGTVKGSYTGSENRPGLFEIADGGTLFLDEINSMEISVQAKLLKAIEEKKITRIGGVEPIATDVRIVSAINEPPSCCLQNNKLREDLFYRLSVVLIEVPPLKSRPEDIRYLTKYFIDHYNKKMGRSIIDIAEDVENLFQSYPWPGNIRELKNIIEGAFNLSSSRILQLKDIPDYIVNSGDFSHLIRRHSFREGLTLNEMVDRYEKSLIRDALRRSFNLTEAAGILGISRQSLNYKIEKYKLRK